MDKRILAITFAALAACLMFVVIFVNGAAPQCLPQRVLGTVPKPAPTDTITFKGSAQDAAILHELAKAAGSTAVESYANELEEPYCHSKELALVLELSATILVALAVGLWTARRQR